MTIIPFSISPLGAPPGAPPGRFGPYRRSTSTPELLRRRPKPSFLVRLVAVLRELRRRQRSRRELARFDATMLKDIGLTYTDVEFEINKPFWRL